MKRIYLVLLSSVLMVAGVLAENTKTVNVTFSNFAAGSQYAVNERHDLGDGLIIYTTKCHFTTELRIYSSSSNNGYVVSAPLPGRITQMTFSAACVKASEPDKLEVFGSIDGVEWVLVKNLTVNETSYNDYAVSFGNKEYTYFKLDVKGDNQLRIKSMSVTYVYTGEDIVSIALPTFTPGTSTFSSKSLNVTIAATEGCDVYYTTDGSTPLYVSADDYVGVKGNEVTIYASDSPTILKAIAVDLATGKCSEVSSATYVYVPVPNDGSYERPYIASEVKAMTTFPEKKVWVKGTICGVLGENYNDFIASNINKSDNLALGDGITYIAVRLTGNEMMSGVNLKDHLYLLGKEMLVQGVIEEYFGKPGVKYPTQYEIAYDVSINSYGYASLYLDMPVSVPQDAVAYYCTTEGAWANLLPVGAVVPNNTGVVVTATPNSTCRFAYTAELNADETLIQSKNQLIGFVEDFEVVADGNAYYALNVKEDRVGFYIPQTAVKANDATAGFVAKANKAYLKVSESTNSIAYALQRGGETSDITPVLLDSECVVLDLQGRVVTSPTAGIYIVNGKKIVVRQ